MNKCDKSSFFTIDEDNWITAKDGARGPWSEDACHAGPPTGMIARALEQCVRDKQLVRLTLDLSRPIPFAGFRISTEVIRSGRAVTNAIATLFDEDNKVCVRASSVHISPTPMSNVPTAKTSSPAIDDMVLAEFPHFSTNHNKPGFSSVVDVGFPKNQPFTLGQNTFWMRTPPLLDNEDTSPFQQLCSIADCGNAFSRNENGSDYSFVNPDLTIVAHRLPKSQWLASNTVSHWQDSGIGMSQAELFDEYGPVATALQTILLQRTQA